MARITKPKKRRHYNTEGRMDRQRIYQTSKWKRLRWSKLFNDPLCELCASHKVITPAEDVHHIISFMSTEDPVRRNQLAFDRNNLQSLCRACHHYQHGIVKAEDTPWGRCNKI